MRQFPIAFKPFQKKAGSAGGSEPFVIPVTWDATNSIFKTVVTAAELAAAIEKDPYNIFFDIANNVKTETYKLRAIKTRDGGVAATVADNGYKLSSIKIQTFCLGTGGPQGFGIYYDKVTYTPSAGNTITVTTESIPEVI